MNTKTIVLLMQLRRKEKNAKRLALAFRKEIAAALPRSERLTIDDRNKTQEYLECCATHDFCDANVYMEAAYRKIFKKPTAFNDETTQLMNAAWDLAKSDGFSKI